MLPPPHAVVIGRPTSRFNRIRNWTDNLKAISLAELRKERAYWQMRLRISALKNHDKDFRNRIRDVEMEMASRVAAD